MSGFTDDHFKLLNLQEIEQREKEIEQAKVSDFLDADGEIDTNKILERGYLIQAFTFENGKITNFKLSNGDKYPFGKSGHVYMIQAENGLIKIGASTNVKGRLNLRALLEEYLDRFGDDMRLNHQNVGHIQGMVTDIGRLVERIARIQNQTALTVAEIQLLNVRLSDLIVKYVEHDKLENFYRELDEALGLPAGQPRQITAPGGNGNNSSVA